MDILDRLLGHDLWTTRHLLVRCQELSSEQLHQTFDAGHSTLHETFDHLIGNVETWTDLMAQNHERLRNRVSIPSDSIDTLRARLEAAYAEFATLARTIRDAGRLDELWTDVLDNPPQQKTYGGAITHVILHNMGHRSELLHMLERLDMAGLIEGDLLTWETQIHSSVKSFDCQ